MEEKGVVEAFYQRSGRGGAAGRPTGLCRICDNNVIYS